ncbi:hypothetical protein G647_01307 [Cladophialophora carrionii CBS 160.54]|uniref:CFEM domain-containing protein n=1 Tax=Cladophialophora carrionii CBS 160.54 TaxID=1279043 RepID=V9DPR6_9EURO|nr:uncharacterized protein G647_01307 [Cladophialophora carrionii CBS 160.54]ETI28855.1 hypothetical protein G647_01307 [Cladophialophora carrionii CBS 160.54]
MRFFSIAAVSISTLLHLAASQDLSTLPSCAVTCALNAIGGTGCAATDAACVCSATSFLTDVQACISTACSAADQAATLAFAQQYCGSAGITITLPTASASAPPAGPTFTSSPTIAPPATPATTTSYAPASYTAVSSAAPPGASYTGAASALKQQWAGFAGVVGLGVAALL